MKFLAPLGWLYGGIMRWRRRLYARGIFASHQLPGYVIAVGNIEAGGTGKSPVVMALAEQLLKEGARPAILTRGYRSGLTAEDSAALEGSRILMVPESGRSFHADEATMQAQRLKSVPVILGSRRWQAAQRYLLNHPAPTHWILDDGFQHLKLKRQLDIVLVDAGQDLSQGRCIPAGRLREFPSTLAAADLVFLTRSRQNTVPESLRALATAGTPIIPVQFQNSNPEQVAGPESAWIQQRSVLLALGIACPERVISHCREQGFPVVEKLLTGDHELFPLPELRALVGKVESVLTTEKDFWRQPSTLQELQKPIYILPLELRFPTGHDLPGLLASFTQS